MRRALLVRLGRTLPPLEGLEKIQICLNGVDDITAIIFHGIPSDTSCNSPRNIRYDLIIVAGDGDPVRGAQFMEKRSPASMIYVLDGMTISCHHSGPSYSVSRGVA